MHLLLAGLQEDITMAANGPLKWHGGKSYLAKYIHAIAPKGYTHRCYVFAGGLGELWGWKHEGISETANDINRQLTNFWMVLADRELFPLFCREIEATPLSEPHWIESDLRDGIPNPRTKETRVDEAVRFFIWNRQSRQGLGKDFATPTKRIRRGMNENVSAWLSAVEGLSDWHERFKRVEIRNLPFQKFIPKYDHSKVLFYCDPPYLHSTRSSTGEYEFEMTPVQHRELLDMLSQIDGKFILSGYKSNMYLKAEKKNGWNRKEVEIDNKASSSKKKEDRIECLWTNY